MNTPERQPRLLRRLIGGALLCGASLVLPGATDTNAVNATVSNLSDDVAVEGSLRWALAEVLSGSTLLNRIDVNPDLAGRIVLESGLPTITKPITITGPGQSRLVIDGNGHSVFDVDNVGVIGAFIVTDLTIAGGLSTNGGAIDGTSSTIVVEDVTFRDNNAPSGDGGAIRVEPGFLSVTNSTFEDNGAEDGGAISVTGAALTVVGSTFTRNAGATNGGSIHARTTTVEVTGSTFDSNFAGDFGGAIAATQVATLSVADSDFTANSAEDHGGAIFHDHPATGALDIRRSLFEANTVSRDGGAVWFDGTVMTAEMSAFADNVAGDHGGAVFIDENNSAIFTNTALTNNIAGDAGGAVFASPRPNQVTFEESTISGNSASLASAVYAADVIVSSSDVIDNLADESTIYVGGAPLQKGSLVVSQSTVDGNTGGAITAILTDASVSFSTISNNSGPRSGAMELDGTQLDIDHSTLSGNDGQIVDGIYSRPPPDPILALVSDVNIFATTFDGDGVDMGSNGSFLIDHTAIDGPLRFSDSIDVTASSSTASAAMPPGTDATNSEFGVDLDLGLLADNGGDTSTVVPQPGSPVIDKQSEPGTPTTDQRGFPRPSGPAVDIGAVEVQGGEVSWQTADSPVEGGGGVVRLTRTGGNDAVGVRVVDKSGTAESGVDYAPVSELVVWEAGEDGTKTISISALDDDVVDDGETFDLVIEATGGAQLVGADSVTVTIIDGYRPFVESLTPARVVDTRSVGETVDGLNRGEGRREPGGTIEVDLAGRAGVPDDARAVVLNLTAVRPDTTGFVTMHPCGERPLASSLNFAAGSNVGNEVIAGLSTKGTTCLYTSTGTDITIDIVGYVPDLSPVQQVTPARILETRENEKTVDGVAQTAGRLDANSSVMLPVAGRGGVPADAAAVIINVTAVNATGVGFATVHPCLEELPLASSLNYVAGVNRGNEIVAQLSDDGDVCLFTSAAAHLTVDVVGWLPEFVDYAAVTPARLVDTRQGEDTIDDLLAGEGRRSANSVLTVQVSGRAGVPDDATAAVINVTAIGAATTGYFTVWDCESDQPLASSLNYAPGVNGGNEIVAGLNDDGHLCVYTFADTHLAVDIVGYLS